jgi:hypothetical protein
MGLKIWKKNTRFPLRDLSRRNSIAFCPRDITKRIGLRKIRNLDKSQRNQLVVTYIYTNGRLEKKK